MERAFYLELAERLESGHSVVMATVVRSWGSTPREMGAKMLVDAQGRIHGSIGGGGGEAKAWQVAREVWKGAPTQVIHIDLTGEAESDIGNVCGGRQDVLVELLNPEDLRARALARAIREGCEPGRELALLVVLGLTGPGDWHRGETPPAPPSAGPVPGTRLSLVGPEELVGTLGDAQADSQILEHARKCLARQGSEVFPISVGKASFDVFIDVLVPSQELVVAGAGHVARPLCRMASLCGYRVTVIDDRAEFADPVYFPDAVEVVCRPFLDAFHSLEVGSRTHVVLVTRGHKHDEECLRALVDRELAYLGMIGSRRRTRAVFQELEAEGVDPTWLDRVHAPIGIDMGAETPEEIAVAILAEIIAVRRGGKAPSLSLRGQSSRAEAARSRPHKCPEPVHGPPQLGCGP